MRAIYSHHMERLGVCCKSYTSSSPCAGSTGSTDVLHKATGSNWQARLATTWTLPAIHKFTRQKDCSRKLKDKHVRALVFHWNGKELSPGTINNRLAFLRHVCDWTGRRGVMSKRNADYHDGKRLREATVSKAVYVQTDVVKRVHNLYARASLMLQIAFGLRRKEALMIQPDWADRGNRINLKATWTKGGRRREIPLTTAAQREALDYAKSVAGKGSMIPSSLSYKDYRDSLWLTACKSIGLNGTHGFRHAYAQDRYEILAGFACPVRGGPKRDEMTPEQLQLDEWGAKPSVVGTGTRAAAGHELVSGQGVMTDGEIIETGDVRAASGIVRDPGAGGARQWYQPARGSFAHPAGGIDTTGQQPGAEGHAAGEVRINRRDDG